MNGSKGNGNNQFNNSGIDMDDNETSQEVKEFVSSLRNLLNYFDKKLRTIEDNSMFVEEQTNTGTSNGSMINDKQPQNGKQSQNGNRSQQPTSNPAQQQNGKNGKQQPTSNAPQKNKRGGSRFI